MKTKHIVQSIALILTLGMAASAHAQLLGGRGLGGIGGGSAAACRAACPAA